MFDHHGYTQTGTLPNVGTHDRSVLALGWRPAWAGPIAQLSQWHPDELAQLPPEARAVLADPNTREGVIYSHPSKPEGMARAAPGINPSRWGGEATSTSTSTSTVVAARL